MQALRQFMDQHDMTQADLARRLRLSPEAVSLVMTERRRPSNGLKLRFVEEFGLEEYRRIFIEEQTA